MNAKKSSPTKVVTGKVRLSYANVWEPRAQEEGKEPKYSTAILIPKTDTATVAKINAAVEFLKKDPGAQAKWAVKSAAALQALKTPLRDGDIDRADDPNYKGMWFLNANSKNKPGIVDAMVNPILDREEVYSGCFARVSINFYAYNESGNKGIGAGLQNIQKVGDGERLAGGSRAEDDFEQYNAEDDELFA